MTSSLVGSEMCIRDSSTTFSHREGDVASQRPRGFVRSACSIKSRGWPVSYTHLTLPTICSV
eukprot:9144099-Prorocentrum_lima.AAC.1